MNPQWRKQNVYNGYHPYIPLARTATPAERDFFNGYMAWMSTEPFPNNLATGWFDGAPNAPYSMFDFQQQRVINHVVEGIIAEAKAMEDRSIGFTFAGVIFDVPMLRGEFATWGCPGVVGRNCYTNLSALTGTGRDSALLHSGITHEYPTYSDGHAAFFKRLNLRLKQEFPNSKLIHEPGRLYRTDWIGGDEWLLQIMNRPDGQELVSDFLSQEHGGTDFVDDPCVYGQCNAFGGGNYNPQTQKQKVVVTKDMVGSSQPLHYRTEAWNRLIAAKAAIHGAWYNWFGRFGELGRNGDTIENVAPRLKLIRVLPNWDNLSRIPLRARSWNGTVYASPRSHADPDVMYSRHWKTGKLFVVFNTHSGVVTLRAGETVRNVQRIDAYFAEAGDGSIDLTVSGAQIRLKPSVTIPGDSRSGQMAGVGYIITLGP